MDFSPVSLFKESNFRIIFKNDLPAIDVMVTVSTLPGFSIGKIEIPRPGIYDRRPSDHLTFNELTLTVLCDEKLEVYKEFYNCIFKTSNPHTAEYTVDYPIFDGTLFLMTNKNNIQHKIVYYNCFFESIGDIHLQSITQDDKQLTFDITLSYTFFDFLDIE